MMIAARNDSGDAVRSNAKMKCNENTDTNTSKGSHCLFRCTEEKEHKVQSLDDKVYGGDDLGRNSSSGNDITIQIACKMAYGGRSMFLLQRSAPEHRS